MSMLLTRPAGPPAAEVRPTSAGIGRSTSKAAEHVSDASGGCRTAEQITGHE
jgi:hypothetical protein